MNSDYLSFLKTTFNDFEGITIVKSNTGEYLYANPKALKLMKVNDLSEIQGKRDSDFRWSKMFLKILQYDEDVNFINYTGEQSTSLSKILYQRTNVVIKGEVTATILNLSFIKKQAAQYQSYNDGSVSFTRENGKEEQLTPIENAIIKLLLLGYHAKDIAEKIGLTHSSLVKNRSKIYSKLGCSNKRETIEKIYRTGLIKHFID